VAQVTRRLACLVSLLAVVLALATAPASAAPTVSDRARPAATAQSFDGIAALENCSASVVRWPSSRPRDRAMVLTNGHCHGQRFLRARQVVVDRPYRRDVTLLAPDRSDVVTLRTQRVLYATMFRTDVALYSLRPTYRQLRRRHDVSALTIAPREPAGRGPIVVVSGYWKRTYRCDLNGFVHRLHEGAWDWARSLRYSDDGCHIIGGTSGSPVLRPGGRRVVGVNNTLNEEGLRCRLNNPCEENRAGRISVHRGRGYGQQTWWLTTCVRADRTFDVTKRGCRLPH
jgi:hypothetical protein